MGGMDGDISPNWGLSWWHCVATAAALWIGYKIWHYTLFIRSGIPGPLPIPFYANIKRSKEAFYICEQKWIEKYGKVMGFFSIAGPTLVIADVKMLKQMFIKEFNNFRNRGPVIFIQSARLRNMLINLKDQQWRNVRHTIIPAFTSSKIKLMTSALNECAEDVILQKLRQLDGEAVEIKKLYGAYTICCIAVAGFGVELHSQSENGNTTLAAFENNAKEFFSRQKHTKWLIMGMLQEYLPGALIRYFDIGLVSQASVNFFFDLSAEIFKERKEGKMQGTFVDFMQLMINAHQLEDEESEEGSGQRSPQGAGAIKVKLSMEEVVSQCVMFLMAGYETTSACLIFTSYLLASHPDVQEKLAAEVKTVMLGSQSNSVTLDLINKMTYLDKVVNESLRLYPPIARVTRVCTKDTTLQGLNIKKGTRIIAPSWTIHRSPEFWPDPLTFNPDRFSAENDSLNMDAFLSFGDGPRSCLGNRFALAEIKIALARILTEFRIEMAEDTPQTLELGKGVFLAPRHPVPLKFVPVA
ncbi:cytochrome P450 3A13-like [Patiria miniata]|uniref:Cytochrome P450 n=1 Tax=Patiria miniata TaxID=46514 RepID=A0A914AJC9_PATMI|nr:cytochrome P450 3A13-like [Patiria miniata]